MHEEILLLEADPEVFCIEDCRTRIGWVWRAVWHHDFGHNDESVLTRTVWENCNWLQHAVRAAAISLLGRAAVEAPYRAVFEGESIHFAVFDLGLTAKVCNGLIAIEPDVFEFDLAIIVQ